MQSTLFVFLQPPLADQQKLILHLSFAWIFFLQSKRGLSIKIERKYLGFFVVSAAAGGGVLLVFVMFCLGGI